MALLVLLNNFLHDFSAAGWLFTTIFLWAILRTKDTETKINSAVISIVKISLIFMRFSLAGIVIFGIFRALAYKRYEWSIEAGNGQVTLLIIKHVVLFFFFVIGILIYRRAKNLINRHSNEK